MSLLSPLPPPPDDLVQHSTWTSMHATAVHVLPGMLRYLGVAEDDILVETRSHTTHQNLAEAKALMDEHVLKSAVIVSDPLHLRRAHLMAKHLGISAETSPTPTTRYRSARARFHFLIREIYFLHHYVITGD